MKFLQCLSLNILWKTFLKFDNLIQSDIYIHVLKIHTVFYIAVEPDASSNVVIDVSQAVEINSQISCLLVKCTFYYNGSDLDIVTSLSLYGSSPYGNMKSFDKLAFVEEKNSIGRVIRSICSVVNLYFIIDNMQLCTI